MAEYATYDERYMTLVKYRGRHYALTNADVAEAGDRCGLSFYDARAAAFDALRKIPVPVIDVSIELSGPSGVGWVRFYSVVLQKTEQQK